METFTVDSKGAQLILCTLSRTRVGASLHVLVHPDVEDFFRENSKGMTEAVEKYGRYWESSKPLRVWVFPSSDKEANEDSLYTMWAPGWMLMASDGDTDKPTPNISFLRLVGASQDGGITINIDALMSRKYVQETAKVLSEACGTFYNDFIQDIHISISISKATHGGT